MKNWSEARAVTGSTYDQFKAHITSGNEFIYYFSDASREGMKKKFQELFTNPTHAKELINLNNGNNIFSKLGYTTVPKLISGANNINNPLFDFIK